MPGLNSFSHWTVLLVLVLLVFGTGKLRNAGRDLGSAIADFRKGLKDAQSDDTALRMVRPDVDGKQQP
ncbi:twin-arginine translocase TatA/TatE family subunit [Rhodanobacter glycinis]|uniref:twin-arginine translocase TatA/TatE family subunit n=1 Tax=Rhodanobacter glycinis TaxID=582702 RepID=UPI00112CE826|nr:twin-arginine translocase TatA/TatE family subunit [Rhodanobacter glycinis]TPG45646.1 twin-arginine translocase TatA/TatE family subunit [Rhodanobacter glycinis]